MEISWNSSSVLHIGPLSCPLLQAHESCFGENQVELPSAMIYSLILLKGCRYQAINRIARKYQISTGICQASKFLRCALAAPLHHKLWSNVEQGLKDPYHFFSETEKHQASTIFGFRWLCHICRQSSGSRRIQGSSLGSNPGLDNLAQTDPGHPVLPEEQVHRQDQMEISWNSSSVLHIGPLSGSKPTNHALEKAKLSCPLPWFMDMKTSVLVFQDHCWFTSRLWRPVGKESILRFC